MVVTERTRIRTHPERAVPDEAEAILAAGLVAHVGFVVDGQPVVIPMGYHYEDGKLYLHGSRGGRLPRTLRDGVPVCVEVTLLDGLVASRHALYHSMNYRSAIAFGRARSIADAADLKITELLEITVDELNAKQRSGPPKGPEDADADAFGTCGVFPVPER
jgi:nitroimidazol reductase NimA-like FMN-containing flavoprotein (pyridoxamine 5'-phosphate oxidase superfamily)